MFILYPDFYSAYRVLIFQGRIGTTLAETHSSILAVHAHVSIPMSLSFFIVNSEILHLALKFRLILEMNIFGLPGAHASTSQTSDASCPIELPINAA